MPGIEINLSVSAEPASVKPALAAALEVPADALAVAASWHELGGSAGLACCVQRRGGDFPTSLEIRVVERGPDPKSLAKALANILGCECLISDDSVNPFTWVLVSRDGAMTSVAVDPDALDSDELVLEHKRGGDAR